MKPKWLAFERASNSLSWNHRLDPLALSFTVALQASQICVDGIGKIWKHNDDLILFKVVFMT
jgi:hypothetical protein